LHPVDVNGVNKIAGEYYHILYHDVYGIKTRALRLTNVYGPGMRIKDARQNFLGIWLRLTLEGKPFEVWGGEQRRDMLYVDDAVDAFLAAAVSPATAGLALNVGGDVPRPLLDIAAALVKANGAGTYTIREFPEERKKIDVGDLVIDDRKFRELAAWAPKTSLAEGIARSVEYYRSRMPQYL
jgi:UDP-glucose 4-epimerase